jgi:hypothetical protein
VWTASFCHPEAPAWVVVDETRVGREFLARAERGWVFGGSNSR